MHHHIQSTKTYIMSHKKELAIGASVVLGAVVLITVITLFARNGAPKVVYQPANACDLLTLPEAQGLLGNKTIASNIENPVLSGNTATSKCGYTDGNPDTNSMVVAAIMVRSGVNDDGVLQNQTEFAASRPDDHVETVNDLGDSAYFDQKLGQLNVLDGHEWIIISYGVGSAPATNNVDDAVGLAYKVVQLASLSTKF
jgi:hypothetical protein